MKVLDWELVAQPMINSLKNLESTVMLLMERKIKM